MRNMLQETINPVSTIFSNMFLAAVYTLCSSFLYNFCTCFMLGHVSCYIAYVIIETAAGDPKFGKLRFSATAVGTVELHGHIQSLDSSP